MEIRDVAKDVNKTVADSTCLARETHTIAHDTARLVTNELPNPRSLGVKSGKRLTFKKVNSAATNLKRRGTKKQEQIKVNAAGKGRKSEKG